MHLKPLGGGVGEPSGNDENDVILVDEDQVTDG